MSYFDNSSLQNIEENEDIQINVPTDNSINNYESIHEGNNSFEKNINEYNPNESNNNSIYYDYKIICEECYNFPVIYFNNDGARIKLICDCKEYINMEPNYFMKTFIKKENEENHKTFSTLSNKIRFFRYCLCDEHLGEKYNYYCTDCKENLCRICYTEKDDHIYHTLIDFNGNDLKQLIEEILKNLPSIFDTNSSISSEDQNKYFYYIEIFREIFNIYEKYPCHNLYLCIKNIYDFIKKVPKNNGIQVIKPKAMQIYFKIKYPRELKTAFETNTDGSAIKTIRLNKMNFNSLNILSNKDFQNLIQLVLSNNHINNLTPLLNSKFPVLEVLNLSMNRIDDENVNYLFKIDMPKLKDLNLVYNELKKFDFFKKIHVFKQLTILYIGLNKFNKEISEIDENTIYDCSIIEEIGFTKGVFSDESIDLISKFKFEKLKILYLSCNNLSSLSFIDKLNCKRENLEEIWLRSNNLNEFYPLIKFKNLKKIILNNNNINNIDKLDDFVKNFNQLELINFSRNNIDKNDPANNKIKEEVIQKSTRMIRNKDNNEVKLFKLNIEL